MDAIRPYEPRVIIDELAEFTEEDYQKLLHTGYRRAIIPRYAIMPGDQAYTDEHGAHRTGPGWWWCYHYGTDRYFTIYNPDERQARMTARENGWQFEGAATCKC